MTPATAAAKETRGPRPRGGGGGGDHFGFQVKGMIEGFFGFEIFDFVFFLGRKMLASIFFSAFSRFLEIFDGSESRHLGLNFVQGIFWGFV